MSQLRVSGRNVASVVCLAALLMYIAYFTSELYTRLNNIKKFERLNQYDKEVRHRMWGDYWITNTSQEYLGYVVTLISLSWIL